MFKKELLIPVLLGLGLYAENTDLKLSNNTTMLLLLYVLLENQSDLRRVERQTQDQVMRPFENPYVNRNRFFY